MLKTFNRLVRDESGFVVSAELVLIATVAVIGLLVGLSAVRDAAVSELSDVAGAVQDANQSFSLDGVVGHNANTAGFDFVDGTDECDSGNQPAPGTTDNCITFSGINYEEGAFSRSRNTPNS